MVRGGHLRGERGAAVLWAVLLAAVVLGAAALAGQIARAAALQHRASAAADLAALAGANALLRLAPDPCSQAAGVARANGAALVSCTVQRPGGGPQVAVVVQGRRAAPWLGPPMGRARAGLVLLSAAADPAPAWPP